MGSGKSRVEISAGCLRHNFEVLKAAANLSEDGPEIEVLAVIKADAYGHGAALCAPVLARAGARWLGVSDVAEGAAALRAMVDSGVAETKLPRVLVMCGMACEDAGEIVNRGLIPVVWSVEQIAALSAAGHGKQVRIHLEIDTGMARQGAQPGRALEAVLQSLTQSPNIVVDGVMTHFAAAEVSGSSLTALQQRRFETALDQIRAAGIRPAWVHAGNSSSVEEASVLPWLLDIAKRVGARPMIRTGLGLYGYLLPLEGMSSHLPSRLEPVMTWKTEVIDLREIEAGDTVGYSATFVAPRPMRLALLPVGYADGLRRELSSTPQEPGGWVVIGGHRAPIIGRISMNLTVVDISDLSEVQLGDDVVLLGPGMTAEDHGALAGTIPYEILCCVRGQQVLVP